MSALISGDRALHESTDTREVYINPLLHRRLKLLAAERGKSIREVVEPSLWTLVGGEPQSADKEAVK